jgi:phospholipase/carboxylesterase
MIDPRCLMSVTQDATLTARHAAAQVVARPHAPRPQAVAPTGPNVLAGVPIYVPMSYHPASPVGVLVMLHGAGGKPSQALALVESAAAREGFIVVTPKSVGLTWDRIEGEFGGDVAQLDRVLRALFDAYAIDPARVAIGGFSDGASYALSLGLANGALFRTVLAFSPGFERAPRNDGRPRIFVAHGIGDRVLPIACSRRIVPSLQRARYEVEYVEFEGGHMVPDLLLDRAVDWWLYST